MAIPPVATSSPQGQAAAPVPPPAATPAIAVLPPATITAATSQSDYSLWVNIALATASVSVTCVGVIVAITAVVGFQQARRMLKREAGKHAKASAEAATKEYLASDGFKAHLAAVANGLIRDQIVNKVTITLGGSDSGGGKDAGSSEWKDNAA